MHLAERLTVHLGIGDNDALRHQWRLALLVSLFPAGLYLRTDESLDGLGIGFSADDVGFIAHLKDSILKRCGQLTVVEEMGADYIAVEEV